MQSGQWGKLLVIENYCKPLEKKSQTVEPVVFSAPRGTVESNPNLERKGERKLSLIPRKMESIDPTVNGPPKEVERI